MPRDRQANIGNRTVAAMINDFDAVRDTREFRTEIAAQIKAAADKSATHRSRGLGGRYPAGHRGKKLARIGMLRGGEQRGSRSEFDDHAALHHRDPVAYLR